MVLFFGVMNTYAADNNSGTVDPSASVKVSPSTSGIKAFINLAWGLATSKIGEDNMGSQGLLSVTSFGYSTLALFVPGLTEGGDAIKNSGDTVPKDMKQGLIGLEESAANYAYSSYPSTSITQHLADEWVPGYKDSNTATYAAEGDANSGYTTLMNSGISPLWTKIRDLAYIFFVVIMIAVGFMIMFRAKIGPQTLVSIGNFLPGVIVSLVLITFSFAIAGVLIDLGGVVTGLISQLYGSSITTISVNSIGSLVRGMFVSGNGSLTGVTWTYLGIEGLATTIAIVVAIFTTGGAAVIVGLIGLLLVLVLVGIVFVGAVKVLITLYKAFFGILLGVVIGPIQLMVGAFPGKGYVTMNWFLSLLKNVLTFPMVFAIVNLPNYIASQPTISLSLPDKLTNGTGNTIVSINGSTIGFLIMFVLRVVVLYFAAESPKYLEAWFPSNTPKPVAEGLANARESLSKIPLVGGLFK
jgi:hypothetical protein